MHGIAGGHVNWIFLNTLLCILVNDNFKSYREMVLKLRMIFFTGGVGTSVRVDLIVCCVLYIILVNSLYEGLCHIYVVCFLQLFELILSLKILLDPHFCSYCSIVSTFQVMPLLYLC